MILDGNEAVARVSYLFTELASIYPITPSSPMAEHVEEYANKGVKNLFGESVKVIEMQSEAGAAGVLHGALQAGTLATTFTASQGLLLMIPNMYKIAGEMLPCVIHVAARSLSTHALSILGDHQDVYATRMTGFTMLASSSVEEAGDMAVVAHLSTLASQIPILHFFDGFRTSHELSKVNLLEEADVKDLLPTGALENFRTRSILGTAPYTIGTNQNDDIYFQAMEARNKFYNQVPDIVNSYMEKINEIKGTHYQPFEYYGSSIAKEIIVAMGSVCETIKETVDALNQEGYHVGLVLVHLYRPFSKEYLMRVIPKTVEKVAVLDRTKESGSIGEPLYLDVKSALDGSCQVYGGRYGLSSKNTNPACIKAVYDFLKQGPSHNFTVGILDDVTHLSLNVDSSFKLKNSKELLIYGYGSDGSVSTGKSLVKTIGKGTSYYVQNYSEYDSKKSGGVTVSHIRLSKEKIRSTYYVETPDFIVITKDQYLQEFDCLSNICQNGILLINTTRSKEELLRLLKPTDIKMLLEKKVTVYCIRAYELSRKLGLKDKISMIMESAILNLLKEVNYELLEQELISFIEQKFRKKGQEVVEANIASLKQAMSYVEKIELKEQKESELLEIDHASILEMIHKRKGGELATSAFLKEPDGRFVKRDHGTKERGMSEMVPRWIQSNCIQCNQCSFVCPHGVIRPFLLSKEEYLNAPDFVKQRVVKPIGPNLEEYYYLVSVSIQNCTGCGLCIKTCPTLKKALEESKLSDEIRNQEQAIFDYASKHISSKDIVDKYTVKGSQLRPPKFEFCGACSGCGQTAYIRILTQLLGKSLVISNATGCSSIYGASIPSLPYHVSFASSLFEDNAEYGYGMVLSQTLKQNQISKIMKKYETEYPCITQWLLHKNNVDITRNVYEKLKEKNLPEELKQILEEVPAKSIWCIGGDGWAYDIGYGGIDHVLSTHDNINLLILDSEVYSNTGGQSSKASTKGSVASFTMSGKKYAKKDLAAIAMLYPHVYVAQISLGANMMKVIQVMKEAILYDGPSIIIAYTPCISHGIKGGMQNSLEMEKLAVTCGYFPIFHRNPETKTFRLDFKNVDFDQYDTFLERQSRFQLLHVVNQEHASYLLCENKEEAMKRFAYYKNLEEESN